MQSHPQHVKKYCIDPEGVEKWVYIQYTGEGAGIFHGKRLRFSHRADQISRHVRLILRHKQSKGRINAAKGDYAESRVRVCECVCCDTASEPVPEITAVCNGKSSLWHLRLSPWPHKPRCMMGVIFGCYLMKWILQFTFYACVNNFFGLMINGGVT